MHSPSGAIPRQPGPRPPRSLPSAQPLPCRFFLGYLGHLRPVAPRPGRSPPFRTVTEPDTHVDRALAALTWAALRAEAQAAAEPGASASTDDFRAAAEEHPKQVRELLDRVVMGAHAEQGLEALRECGALAGLLPAVERMVGFGDDEWRHKDLWKHTKQVLDQAPARLAVRWAALLHDIGKVKTRSIAPDGQVHFFGHAEVGARMFKKLCRRWPLFADDPELREAVHFLILHHLRASQYKRNWTDSAVRRFAREMGKHMDDLFCLSRADITTKRPERRRRGLQQIEHLSARVSQLAAIDAQPAPLPTGLGNLIMERFGLEPSRLVGEIKRALELLVAAGDLPAQANPTVYLEYIERHRSEFGLE